MTVMGLLNCADTVGAFILLHFLYPYIMFLVGMLFTISIDVIRALGHGRSSL
jgi:hypothetical protein